jgi:hypothetical protein
MTQRTIYNLNRHDTMGLSMYDPDPDSDRNKRGRMQSRSIDSDFGIPHVSERLITGESVDAYHVSPYRSPAVRSLLSEGSSSDAELTASRTNPVRKPRAPKKFPLQPSMKNMLNYAVSYDPYDAVDEHQQWINPQLVAEPRSRAFHPSLLTSKSVSFHVISSPTDSLKKEGSTTKRALHQTSFSSSSNTEGHRHYHEPQHMLRSPHNSLPAYHGVYERKHAVKYQSTVVPSFDKFNLDLVPLSHVKTHRPSKYFTYEYDFAVVFPIVPAKQQGQSTDAKFIMHTMLRAGLEIFPYVSACQDELFVLIRAPVSAAVSTFI